MDPERGPGEPEVIGRLRLDAEIRLPERVAPRWAKPVGWLIAIAIVVVVVIVALEANPW